MGFGVIGILVDFFVRGFFFSVVLVFGLGWKFLGLLAYGFFFLWFERGSVFLVFVVG